MLGVRLLGNSKVCIDKFPDPKLKDDEVLVKVTVSAICGSDLGDYRSDNTDKRGTGHEAVGVIEDPGKSTCFKKGDRVGVIAVYGCGRCEQCKEGHFPYCQNLRPLPPFQMQYLNAPDYCCLPLPDDIPDETAIVVTGCGIGVAYHASKRLNAGENDTVLVVGAGPIGLSAVIVLKYLGAKVISADLNPYRLKLAKEIGADYTIEVGKEDAKAKVKEVNSGRLANKAFHAATTKEALKLAVDCTGPRRDIVLVGGGERTIDFFNSALSRDGGIYHSWHFHVGDYEEMLKITLSEPVSKLVTHRLSYQEAETAFQTFVSGNAGKVILLWE